MFQPMQNDLRDNLRMGILLDLMERYFPQSDFKKLEEVFEKQEH